MTFAQHRPWWWHGGQRPHPTTATIWLWILLATKFSEVYHNEKRKINQTEAGIGLLKKTFAQNWRQNFHHAQKAEENYLRWQDSNLRRPRWERWLRANKLKALRPFSCCNSTPASFLKDLVTRKSFKLSLNSLNLILSTRTSCTTMPRTSLTSTTGMSHPSISVFFKSWFSGKWPGEGGGGNPSTVPERSRWGSRTVEAKVESSFLLRNIFDNRKNSGTILKPL